MHIHIKEYKGVWLGYIAFKDPTFTPIYADIGTFNDVYFRLKVKMDGLLQGN